MTGIYKIADKVIEINSLHSEVHAMCADYRFDGTPDFSIEICQENIDFERKKSADEDIYEGHEIRHFPDSYLETLAVYRKIADKMLEYDTILFHGSVVAVDNQAFLFTAKSGTGKSTHTKLWREYFGDKAVMVNDDKPLIHVSENGVKVFGTPWDGKHRISTNISVPLKAVCILERAEENHIEKISSKSAYAMLMQQIYRPLNPALMMSTLKLVDKLSQNTGLYRLGCNISTEAVEIAYNGMKG